MTKSVAIVAPSNIAAMKWLLRVAFRATWRPSLDDLDALRGLENSGLVDAALQELLRGTQADREDPEVEGVRQMMRLAIASPHGLTDITKDSAWANVIGQQKARAVAAERDLDVAKQRQAHYWALLSRCLVVIELSDLHTSPKLAQEIREALGIDQPIAPV